MGKLKNLKAAGNDEIMAFESVLVSEDWRSAVIVTLYKGKG